MMPIVRRDPRMQAPSRKKRIYSGAQLRGEDAGGVAAYRGTVWCLDPTHLFGARNDTVMTTCTTDSVAALSSAIRIVGSVRLLPSGCGEATYPGS